MRGLPLDAHCTELYDAALAHADTFANALIEFRSSLDATTGFEALKAAVFALNETSLTCEALVARLVQLEDGASAH